MAKVLAIAKTAVLSAAIYYFFRSIIDPDPKIFLFYDNLSILAVMALAAIDIVYEVATFVRRKEKNVSVTSMIVFIWFLFLFVTDSYRLFLGQDQSGLWDFTKVLSAISIVLLGIYIYSTIRKRFNLKTGIRIRPYTIIMLSFAGIIFAGTILLLLPVSRNPSAPPVSFIDALFTAASAVCVTGLTVLDTGSQFTRFGQTVIMLLIETGGLGLMTFTAFFSVIIGDRLSLYGKFTLQNAVGSDSFSTLTKFIFFIVAATLAIQLAGAAFLFISFSKVLPLGEAVYSSVFHAVSAFCNAGFSLFKNNLAGFRGDIVVNTGIMLLIVIGGIGFSVIMNVFNVITRREKRLNLHSKLALTVTAMLVFGGALVIFLFERTNVLLGLPVREQVLAPLFASVTARTAGFNTIDYGLVRESTIFFTCLLMFIGASPGSTGGGVKTTTFAVILLNTVNILRDRLTVKAFGREIPFDIIRKSFVILVLALVWVVLATILLCVAENKLPLSKLIFEEISAFGTVGLSTGITPVLGIPAKVILILSMFIGRVGPVTLMYSLGMDTKKLNVRRPEEKINVG